LLSQCCDYTFICILFSTLGLGTRHEDLYSLLDFSINQTDDEIDNDLLSSSDLSTSQLCTVPNPTHCPETLSCENCDMHHLCPECKDILRQC